MSLGDAGMIRICPERDGKCPHGMKCPYWIDRYSCAENDPFVQIAKLVADEEPKGEGER